MWFNQQLIIYSMLLLAQAHHLTVTIMMHFVLSHVAYIVGLVCTYIALTFMKVAQPALLYLVPTTLVSVVILSLVKREFYLFFTGKQRVSSCWDLP